MERDIKKTMPMLKNLEKKFLLKFDYELNQTEMDDQMDCKMYYFDINMKDKSKIKFFIRDCQL